MTRKLLFVLAALIASVATAWADTSLLTAADGWTKITSISQESIADHYYVFVADGQDLMLTAEHTTSGQNKSGNNYVLFYEASAQPFRDLAKVFTLEALGSLYAMRTLKDNTYLFQCSSNANYWRTNDIKAVTASNAPDWCPVNFVYADGAWTVIPTRNSRPLGLFENKAGTPVAGAEVGAVDLDKAQKFQIYAISKADFSLLSATLADVSTALPAEGAMEAGKWYHYDVPEKGSYDVSASIALTDVLYTSDGSVLAADAADAGTALTASMELDAGRIYLCAKTDATISFNASSTINPLDPADGWKQITTLTQADITDTYYVFVADGQNLMLSAEHTTSGQNKGSNHVLFYEAMTEPFRDQAKVFTLEVLGEVFAMRNLQNNEFLFQCSSNANYWRTNDIKAVTASNAPDWCPVNFVYADGSWTIIPTRNSRPLGLFENKAGTPEIGAEVGAVDVDKAQKFQIYAISKADFSKLSATIATAAVTLPAGGAMEAGKWYAFDVPANGSYTINTDDPSKVFCTLDGSILTRDDAQVTTTLQPTMELAIGTIYLKAQASTTVQFAAQGFVAAPSIADGTFIQTLDGITVSFATPASANPFAVLNGATASLQCDSGDQEALALTVTGTTVSFAQTPLKPASSYTLTIPAGAVGYSSLNANPEAVAIQFYTPAVFDGEYFFYNEADQTFLSRGENWGTRATMDQFGFPAAVTTNAEGISRFRFLDNNLYLGSDGYTDKADDYNSIDWTAESAAGGIVLKSSNGSYLAKGESTYLRVSGTSAADAVTFSLKTAAEQKALVAAAMDASVRKAAEAAGLTYTDKASFESFLTENYSFIDFTSNILSPDAGSTTAWTFTAPSSAQNPSAGAYNVGAYGGELYLRHGVVSQTVTVPVPGLYKLSMAGFFRAGTNANCYAVGQKGFALSNAVLVANGTYAAQVPDWYSVCTSSSVPNNVTEAEELMDAGKCNVDLYAYVGDDLQLNIELRVPAYINYGWCIFGNWNLTFIGDADDVFMAHKADAARRWEVYASIAAQATDHSAFDDVAAAAVAALPTTPSEEALAALHAQVWQALCTLLTTKTTPSGQFDITPLLANPTFDEDAAGWDSPNPLGYSSGVAEDFSHASGNISQTLKDMPAGTYTMKVQSFYRTKAYRFANYEYEQGTETIPAQIYFGSASQAVKSINDDARMQPARPSSDVNGAFRRSIPNTLSGANDAFASGQYWNILTTTMAQDGDVTLGIRYTGGVADCWLPFDNFRLYYGSGLPDISLSVSEPFALTEDTRANVTLSRTLKAGQYNPVCLPFDVDASQFQSAWTLAGIETDGATLTGTLIPVAHLKAGQCYWVKVAADMPQLKLDNVLVRACQPDSVPVLWEGGALRGSFVGYKAEVILNPELSGDITFREVDVNDVHATVNLENWQARRFLSEVNYDAASESQIAAYNIPAPARRDQPHQVFVPIGLQPTAPLTVTYANNPYFVRPATVTATPTDGLVELPNLQPQETYYYKVEDASGIVGQGQVNTQGHLRQITLPTVSNVRDMGGWLTAGGKRTRYGFVYRGGELNGDHLMYSGTTLSEADRQELRRLGIMAEVDLREDNDDSIKDVDAAGTTSALGSDAQYIYLNLNQWNAQALQVYAAKFKDVFDFIIANLRADRNVYFHCIWGADRTGAIAFLLNGLLGATPDQLYKDYELTSYSLAGSRVKGTLDAEGEKLPYIQSLEGVSLQMKFYTYLSQVAGVNRADLNWLVRMLGGDTGDLPTDVDELPARQPAAPAVIYDLSGRRVQNPTRRGIYITNGRRIAVK